MVRLIASELVRARRVADTIGFSDGKLNTVGANYQQYLVI